MTLLQSRCSIRTNKNARQILRFNCKTHICSASGGRGRGSARPDLEADIRTAMNNAQEICYRHGISFKCMRAWERVDDLVKKYYEWNESHPQEVADESVISDYHDSCTDAMCENACDGDSKSVL